MADAFIGEIRPFPFNFAPVGWASCNGQLLSIAQNTALFSLLGTTYGGNGTSNFALPNLQGSAALSFGNGPGLTPRVEGEAGGESAVTLLTQQLPAHTHVPQGVADNTAPAYGPAGTVWATDVSGDDAYGPAASANVNLNAGALAVTGGSQPHNNVQPYLVINYCIALQGIYPARS